jgi:phosphoglycerate dehydrogenase-like enzyme
LPLGGTDAVEVAALPPGVSVCNAYGHEAAIGEFAVMMMLAWRHRLFDITRAFRAGSWEWSPLMGGPLRGELAGRTVGIVGLGHIGREIAWRADAFGCRVLAANRTPREAPSGVERVYPLGALDRMLGECDIVVLACALTEETRGLFDRGRLAAMKRDALLVNLARGPVCDEDALYEALRERRIGGAALDTWWQYPNAETPNARPSRHPFDELPNVMMTPHCSPWTEGTVERRARDIARNIDRFVRGEPLANLVLTT